MNVAAFGTGGVVRWFTASELASGSLISSINDGVPSTLTGATIEIVPAPASVAILGASGLITGWRRR